MAEPLVYLQGLFLPQNQAHLSLHDAGFVQGATITDLCRTFHHQLFRWPDHLSRFRQSCQQTLVQVPATDDEIHACALHLIQHNAALLSPGQELALVLFATPGPIGHYLGESSGSGPATFGMHTFPLPWARYRPMFAEGARLLVPSIRQLPAACIDPRLKHRSRLHWWLADQEVRRKDSRAWALLLNLEGYLTETAAANFLLVHQGQVVSPPRDSILNGVSLAVVEELCRELGIPFVERPVRLEDCRGAEEALLAGTAFCLAGVKQIDEFQFTWPGPVYHRLIHAWSAKVGCDIAGQILGAPVS